jgi:hypothetical protein
MKPFVDFTIQKRIESKTKYHQNIFKLILNAIFGKFLENSAKRTDTRIVTEWKSDDLRRKDMTFYANHPTIKDFTILDENIVMVELKKLALDYYKNPLIGTSILDLSKYIMYNLIYSDLPKICANFSLKYVDTDCACILVKSQDFYSLMRDNPNLFDTSNYPEKNPFNILQLNHKMLGKLKDELGGRVIREIILVAPKVYYILVDGDEKPVKRLKGVDRSAVKDIDFNDYRDAVFKDRVKYIGCTRIRSLKLNLYTRYEVKKALSNSENKREWVSVNQSHAYGYIPPNKRRKVE